jgi:hypothetical protein
MTTLSRHWATLIQIVRLPVAELLFDSRLNPGHIAATYRAFTKRHPKYKIIRNKTIGAALIDLSRFRTRDDYLDHIKGRNLGAFHAGRAKSRGYVVVEIDRSRFADQIHEINTSLEQRQGRPMDQAYLEKKTQFDALSNFKYYGVLDAGGRLAAYCNFGVYGNFALFSQLLGHRNNDGTMHLLIVEIVCQLIDEGKLKYVMYDTFFGARPGLQLFKKILGFTPYRAKYRIQ